MTNKLKIATVVVTYNRLELLKECITSLRNQTHQIDEIFVINNSSTDGTEEWLSDQNDLTTITQPNSGSAGGQYTGIKIAFEKGYDWIWCMDDDAEPYVDALEGIIKYATNDVSAVCPDVYDDEMNRLIFHRGNIDLYIKKTFTLQNPIRYDRLNEEVVKIDFSSFVGIMVNRKAVEIIGLPNKYFFIHHDDVEYSLRLKEFGDILLIPKEIIIHKEVNNRNLLRKRFLWKISFRPKYENYWMYYFTYRNHFWLSIKYLKTKRSIFASLFGDLNKESRRILLYDDYKIKRLNLLVKAFFDAIANRLKINYLDLKKQLYGNINKGK